MEQFLNNKYQMERSENMDEMLEEIGESFNCSFCNFNFNRFVQFIRLECNDKKTRANSDDNFSAC